jgi:ubiquinol-cytochrome c reductase cytochrome c1 subunit
MREIKITLVLVFFTLLTYYGIEPYAHHIMHPHTSEADYKFADLNANTTGLERTAVSGMIASGNVDAGREQVMANCTACHTVKAADMAMMSEADLISANGLLPPDLSNAGTIYDEVFLFNFIKDPANTAFNTTYELHKKEELAHAKMTAATKDAQEALVRAHQKAVDGFKIKKSETFSKMPSFSWLGDREVANIVAYFKSISKPLKELSDKEVAVAACGRCHSISYDKVSAKADVATLKPYLGSTPPDLSQMIKSKGDEYLHKFINDPQKLLLGTGMPRVGLTKEAEAKVVNYIEKVGDPKKDERNDLGKYFILFALVLAFFAYGWKKNEFKDAGIEH